MIVTIPKLPSQKYDSRNVSVFVFPVVKCLNIVVNDKVRSLLGNWCVVYCYPCSYSGLWCWTLWPKLIKLTGCLKLHLRHAKLNYSMSDLQEYFWTLVSSYKDTNMTQEIYKPRRKENTVFSSQLNELKRKLTFHVRFHWNVRFQLFQTCSSCFSKGCTFDQNRVFDSLLLLIAVTVFLRQL